MVAVLATVKAALANTPADVPFGSLFAWLYAAWALLVTLVMLVFWVASTPWVIEICALA